MVYNNVLGIGDNIFFTLDWLYMIYFSGSQGLNDHRVEMIGMMQWLEHYY